MDEVAMSSLTGVCGPHGDAPTGSCRSRDHTPRETFRERSSP